MEMSIVIIFCFVVVVMIRVIKMTPQKKYVTPSQVIQLFFRDYYLILGEKGPKVVAQNFHSMTSPHAPPPHPSLGNARKKALILLPQSHLEESSS